MTRFVLVVLFSALGLGWAAEENSSNEESTALHNELGKRHYDHALELMPLEKDIDAIEPKTGKTALGIAATDESADAYDMVKALLVKYGADPDIVDRQGMTPLHHAAMAGNLAVVELLVENAADINAMPEFPGCNEDCPKITPLYMAVGNGKNRVAEWLRANGADRLDPDVLKNLDLQAKMLDALKAMDNPMPPGEDPETWRRKNFDMQADSIAALLESQGMLTEAGAWRQAVEPLWQAIQDNPMTEGMSIETVLQNIMQATAANQSNNAESKEE